jgi:uncharacterized protein
MTPANENKPRQAAAAKCPVCGKPAQAEYKPFCSARCADVDLNRWLTGSYAIPAVEDDEDGREGDREA